MSYYISARAERLHYKASNVRKFYYCSIANDIVEVKIRPSGVYRDCELCKKCEIKLEQDFSKVYNVESCDFVDKLLDFMDMQTVRS